MQTIFGGVSHFCKHVGVPRKIISYNNVIAGQDLVIALQVDAMAKNSILLALLCVWVSVITFLPIYLLSAGYFSVTKKETLEFDRVQAVGGPSLDGASQKLKRGVRLTGDTNDETFPANGLSPAKTLSSAALRREVADAVYNDEHATYPRAAFDLVTLLSSLQPKINNISRIRTPSPEAFRNFIAPVGLPVIFTDLFEGSKLSKWTWDYIKTKWGETIFHNTRQGKYLSKTNKYGKHYVNRVSVKLADFIDIVTGSRPVKKEEENMYITKQRVIPPEALETEFYYPPFYPGSNKKCYLEPTGW